MNDLTNISLPEFFAEPMPVPESDARKAARRFLDQCQSIPSIPENRHTKYKLLIGAVEADPTWWQSWFLVARANLEFGVYPTALACARRALGCEMEAGDRADCRSLVGWLLHMLGRNDEARDILESGWHCALDHIGLLTNLSCALHMLGEDAKGLECARLAHNLDPTNATAELALSFQLRYTGQHALGLRHFEARFRCQLAEYQNYPLPKWQGEAVGSLWIAADQGMGDALSFVRFVPAAAARAGRVLLGAQPALLNLFTAMLAPWPNIMILPQTAALPAVDAWTSTVSLPTALGLTTEEFVQAPQLAVPDFTGMALPKRLADAKLRVGLSWRGAKEHVSDRWRSVPFEQMAELLDLPGVEFYNLQVGEYAHEMHQGGAAALMTDLAPYIQDAAHTVGFLRQLDLVVTIDSFLAHLCGAVGTECWVMLSPRQYDACYAAPDASLSYWDRPAYWYHHLLFWQTRSELTWQGVLKAIRDVLERRLDA